MISKHTQQTMGTLRNLGYKFNIVTEVERRVELHNEVERLDGRKMVMFVAELDGYGNITEWGLEDERRKLKTGERQWNADGEIVS